MKKEEQTVKDLMLLLYIVLVTLSLSPRRFTLERVGCDYLVLRYVFTSHQIIQFHGKNTIILLSCWLQGAGKTSLLSALIKQGKPRNKAGQENIHPELNSQEVMADGISYFDSPGVNLQVSLLFSMLGLNF